MEDYVSILIPTYNRSNMLKKAIYSVLNQTYKFFELIIIDDNSTDNTFEIVNNIGDNRIRYYKNDENYGGAKTRNIGISKSKYDYIAFLDDDDEWLPKKLEKQIKVLKKGGDNCCGVYSGFNICEEGKEIEICLPKYQELDLRTLFIENYIGTTSTILIKKSSLDMVSYFDEKLLQSQEYELYIRLLKNGYSFIPINEPLVNYYIHDKDQITKNKKKIFISKKYILEKHREEIEQFPDVLSKHLFYLGLYSLLVNNSNEKEYFRSALATYKSVKYFLYYIMYLINRNISIIITNKFFKL